MRHHLTHTAQGVPGEAYRYNGFLYGLLSMVAEKVSGKSFADLLVEKIIRPLEMTKTAPSINDYLHDQVLAERSKYYRIGDAGTFVLSEWPSKEIAEALKAKGLNLTSSLDAGGGMISTVLDLAKFDIAIDRNLIVSNAFKETMFTPTLSNGGRTLPYGLGWFVQEHMGIKIVWHYGWAPEAYSSLILKVPGKKATLILLAKLEINKRKGGRVYSTGRVKGMLSHQIPGGILKPGQTYRWRVRITDDDNWVKMQNRSQSEWLIFTMSKSLKYIDQVSEKNNKVSNRKPYFPPAKDDKWERISPGQTGWNETLLDDAFKFARKNRTTQFLILYRGRILKEAYWGSAPGATGDVASVQKSLVSILVGMAREKGLLDIHEPVSRYIGSGWTRMNSVREQQITLYHLLSMTTGMDNRLNRVSEPGGEWNYNTPAYHYLKKVLEAVTQQSLHTLTKQWITKPLGMKSTGWKDRIYMNLPDGAPMSGLHSNVRDLARFGLLILTEGKWAGNTIFKDKGYFKEALSSSQDMNAAYGYLWWLNGRSHYMLPRAKYTRKGYLIPTAPTDLLAAFGVKAQRLYIVPSLSLVVVRRGGAPSRTTKSSFDNSLWERLMHAAPSNSRLPGKKKLF